MMTILLVDDKDDQLYMLESLLTGNGYAVITASNGAEALAKAHTSPPDLVVSDLLMPVMDGYTLLRKWRQDTELLHIPFVVYTATYTDSSDERLAFDLGAADFLVKPMENDELLDRLKALDRANAEPPTLPDVEDPARYRLYSETLIRKLEEKSMELQAANRALVRDMEARTRAEASLYESEERFRLLAENIEEVFWITDVEKQNMLYVSPAYEKIWGRTCLSLYAHPGTWMDAVHPDDRDRILKATEEDQETGAYNETYRIVRPDGAIRWIHDRGFPVQNEHDDVYRIVGTATDITEFREAEVRIEEQAALLDKAHDAIVVRDLEHRVQYWNRSAEELYGWTAEEAMGRKVTELAYGKTNAFQDAMDATLADGEWAGELEQRARNGRRIVASTRWTLVRNEAGQPVSVFIINTDITERKHLERQFLRSQRLESVGTLAGGIAHDLNNLLAPIVMGVDILSASDLDARFLPILENMRRSADRGTNLVKQVLSFARGVEGEQVALSLNHVVLEVEGMVKTSFPKIIRCIRETEAALWSVLGDPTQLHQVLLNLCVNARDAMPEGGQLTVRTQNVVVDEQYAAMHPELSPGRHVLLEVEDNGTGMPADVRERVFEPFFTTKDPGRGTGLGLPTVRTIVRNHSGTISVYSEEGRGTIFKIFLPAVAEDTAPEGPVRASPEAMPRGHGQCILVVDDEASVRSITRQTLEAYGYRVLDAEDGAQALALFADHQDDVSLVLTDVVMPIMEGGPLVEAIRHLAPGIRVIVASGIHEAGEGIPFDAFLDKPYSAASLLNTVATLIG